MRSDDFPYENCRRSLDRDAIFPLRNDDFSSVITRSATLKRSARAGLIELVSIVWAPTQ